MLDIKIYEEEEQEEDEVFLGLEDVEGEVRLSVFNHKGGWEYTILTVDPEGFISLWSLEAVDTPFQVDTKKYIKVVKE